MCQAAWEELSLRKRTCVQAHPVEGGCIEISLRRSVKETRGTMGLLRRSHSYDSMRCVNPAFGCYTK